MAPKKAEGKADAKKKAKKTEEEGGEPKMQPPNRTEYEAKVAEVQKEIDSAQKEQRELTDKIQERSGGQPEYTTKKAEIFAELDVIKKKLDDLQIQKDGIEKNQSAIKEEGREKRQQLGKLKKSIGYTDEGEIENRLKEIEFQLNTETMSLAEEKKLLAEAQQLRRNKPKVGQVAAMEESLGKLQEGSNVKELRQQLNADMFALREERRKISERLDELKAARNAQLGDRPELINQRDAIGAKVQEKIKERNAMRDEFREAERKYNAYLAEERRARQERYQTEREARNKEYEMVRRQKQADKLDEQPHVAEITLIEQTIAFCKSLTATKGPTEKAVARDIDHTLKPEGTEVLLKKEDRDEFYFAPTKGKKAKGGKKAKSDASSKPIKHNAETFRLFSQLKLDAPITTDDIPELLEKLDAQMAGYQEKIKAWEKNRDDLKRKILEEGYNLDEAAKEPEPKAEEEAEEEEAAKPEEEAAEAEAEKEEDADA